MNHIFEKLLGGLFFLSFFCNCSSGGGADIPEPPVEPSIPVIKKKPISLNCGVSASRVTDTGYENEDKIGLYVVNYSGTNAGVLQQIGNHADNVCFTYNGTWKAANELYWKDESTHADFYCYYPYGSVSNIEAHAFAVKEDQSTLTAYKASDFLYGVAKNVAPTEADVNITSYHSFSCMVIKLSAGNGFTAESLAAADIVIRINGIKTNANINLKNGTVVAVGEVESIIPLKDNGMYKALIVPQTVSVDNLIGVTVDGREYKLKKEFTFEGGKRHMFTVTVSKTSNGINVGIGAWEDDGVDNGGTAE